MVSQTDLAANTAAAARDESPPDSAEELLRQLVARVIQRGGACDQRVTAEQEEIVIDAEVGGSRYLVLRMPLPGGLQTALSPREHEIARMVARGHHNKTIADVLNISSWTVCTHLRRIFAKLGVNSRAAMVAKLLERDVLRESPSAAHAPRPAREKPRR